MNVSTTKKSTKPPDLADALIPKKDPWHKSLNKPEDQGSSSIEGETKKEGRKVAIDWNIAFWQPSIELMPK